MSRPRFYHLALFAICAALSAQVSSPVRAQGAPPPAYPNAPSGYNPGYLQQAGPQGQYPAGQQQQPMRLPEGIDALYALEGPNALLLFGTQEGYETARELVRNIDGSLDIIRVQVSLARVTRADFDGNPVPTGVLSDTDIQKLLDARAAGKVPVQETLRLTTREDTEINALMDRNKGEVPLDLVPRVTSGGQIAVEMLQPISRTVKISPGKTTVISLPSTDTAADAPTTLLFLTPTIQPSSYRARQ